MTPPVSDLCSPARATVDRLAYTVPEAAESLHLSLPSVYNLINSGRLRSVKLGKSRRIPADALRDLLAGGDADD